MDAAGEAGERAGEAKGGKLEAIGRHAHHFGHVLIVVEGEKAGAEARIEHRVGDPDARHRDDEHQEIEAAGGRRCELRDIAHHLDAGPAVDLVEHDGGEDEGDRQREQREQLAAQRAHAEHDRSQDQSQKGGAARRERQRGEERPVVLGDERRGGVDAGAKEGAVAEGEIAGIAAEDVP